MSIAQITPTSALERLPQTGDFRDWDPAQAALVEFAGLGQILRLPNQPPRWQGAPRSVVEAFLTYVQRSGLDPLAKQVYAAQVNGKWTILGAVDGFRLVATRTGQYAGQTAKEWLYADGVWRDYWVPTLHGQDAGTKPLAARVGVLRQGFAEPLQVTVTWAEFGMESRFKGDNWGTRPAHMLGIRAETHGLRAAFPHELSGIYTVEDVEDDHALDAEIVETQDWAARIEALDDKADMAALWQEINRAREWTVNLEAKFAAHLSTLTKDSRPPKAGAPGHTGEADLDEPVDAEEAPPARASAEDAWEAEQIAAHERGEA